MKRFTDRVVLAVGGGMDRDGWSNGAAAAVSYAREGAQVAVIDLSEEAANATVAEIASENGEAVAIVGDVTSLASVEAAVPNRSTRSAESTCSITTSASRPWVGPSNSPKSSFSPPSI